MSALPLEPPSEQKTKLIGLLEERELVKVVQKMWQTYFNQELLEKKKELPDYLYLSLLVIFISYF